MMLYYLVMYNHLRNHYARFMISSHDEEEAKSRAIGSLGFHYRLSSILPVCKTDEQVFIEL